MMQTTDLREGGDLASTDWMYRAADNPWRVRNAFGWPWQSGNTNRRAAGVPDRGGQSGTRQGSLTPSLGAHTAKRATPPKRCRPWVAPRPIISTVRSAETIQAISGGLGANGTMMVIDAVGALTVNSLKLLGKRAAVRGGIRALWTTRKTRFCCAIAATWGRSNATGSRVGG
jgi:hypothetical protein